MRFWEAAPSLEVTGQGCFPLTCARLGQHCRCFVESCPLVSLCRDVPQMPSLGRAQLSLGRNDSHTGQLSYMLTDTAYTPAVMGAYSLLGWQIFFLI